MVEAAIDDYTVEVSGMDQDGGEQTWDFDTEAPSGTFRVRGQLPVSLRRRSADEAGTACAVPAFSWQRLTACRASTTISVSVRRA